mgnify:CR=1 FL=1
MAELTFRDLSFRLKKNDDLAVILYNRFSFTIAASLLKRIGAFEVSDHCIRFHNASEKQASNKFSLLISQGMKDLRSAIGGKKAVYIHKNSGIPLIGSIYFGLVDRNTNIIDVRPNTGCNLNCIYCSVDEGVSGRRGTDFVVEEEYLVEEFRKLVSFKGIDGIEAHIGPQGEPMLYSRIFDLVRNLSSTEGVSEVSMDTNGTLLTRDAADSLIKAGMTRFNISINSLEEEKASLMSGGRYPVSRIVETARHIAKRCDLTLAPVWVPGMNDEDIEDIILLAKEITTSKTKHILGIQNFLNYRKGRNPTKAMSMDEFRDKLRALEKKHGAKLLLDKTDYNVRNTAKLPKPFIKGKIIKAQTACQGRSENEMIVVAGGRCISVSGCAKGGAVRTRITRDKHNIFSGELV